MGARICPRCSARVDERRAKSSPYCLSCGAALAPHGPPEPMQGGPSPTFGGKAQQSGGKSALPWILGMVGAISLLAIGGIVILVVVSSSDDDTPPKPEPVASAASAANPKVEVPATFADGAAVTPSAVASVKAT